MAAPLKIGCFVLRGCSVVKEIVSVSKCIREHPIVNAANFIPVLLQVRGINQNQRKKDRQPHIAGDKQWLMPTKKKKNVVTIHKKQLSEEFLNRVPLDDVWIRDMYPEQSYLLEDSIEMHKEFADPTMLNNMDGLIYADMTLNMRQKKKTRVLADISGNIIMPHIFPDGKQKRIVALSREDEVVRQALKMGAVFAGGLDTVKEIKDGNIARDLFDFVVCTPDIITELLPIRSILRDRFPGKNKHNIGSDIEKLMNVFLNGVLYQSAKAVDNKFIGKTSVPFGHMEMTTEQLTENFNKMIETICSHRVIAGPFIASISLRAPPSPEIFPLKVEKYAPGYEEESDDEDEHRPEAVASF